MSAPFLYGFSLDEFIFADHREMHHISLTSLILLRIPTRDSL
ncbi:hypothetical protein SynMVIR181_01394 [Synechococcus sp. MVIR-18-1]|nr:hypothetical protein SynMVIR181_01394 [Synechococcus sp. MVIR-18-1]